MRRARGMRGSARGTRCYAINTDSYVPCIEYNMNDWLNLDEVQAALHVKATEWEMCSDAVWDKWPDADYDLFMQEYYDDIIQTTPSTKTSSSASTQVHALLRRLV